MNKRGIVVIYLKKVILDGFKSFYSQTEIELDSGIIGIVGPNGCGKSNIYDAIQWVLGEQSAKKLRGDQISDVIARGNVRRAEKKQAETFLTFENCSDVLDTDHCQVEVGRRVNREGEGTYFLNGEKVRLKDVRDLFRDTGLGQDLYSSIGQGEVLQLIESKPRERREIIEEAAGVASYRHRRDLTRRRLAKTRNQLEPVEQDLKEKKGRLSQLRGQAEKAQRVRSLQKDLRKKRLKRTRLDYRRLKQRIRNLKDTLETHKDRLDAEREEKSSLQVRKRDLEEGQAVIENRLNRLEVLRGSVRNQHQDLRETLSELRTLIHSQRDQKVRESRILDQLISQYQSELDGLNQSKWDQWLASLRKQISRIELDRLEKVRKEVKSQRRRFEEKREELRERNLYQRRVKQDVGRRKDKLNSEVNELNDSIDSIKEELETILEKHHRIRKKIGSIKHSLLNARQEAAQLKRQLNLIRLEQSVLKDLGDSLRTHRNNLSNQSDRLEKRLKAKRNRVESQEGLPDGVKTLVNGKSAREDDILGLLAEHIQVKEKHRRPIEAILGNRLQDVLVESSEALPALWKFLNRNGEQNNGPVRLRPLREGNKGNNFSPNEGSFDELPVDVLGPAVDFVETSEKARGVVSKLLEGVYLVEDLDDLLNGKKNPLNGHGNSVTMVDMEGSILEGNGVLSLGESDRQNGGLLKQKKELEHLRRKRDKLKEETTKVRSKLNRVDRLSKEVNQRSSRIEESLEGCRAEARQHEKELRQLYFDRRRTAESVDEKFENLTSKHDELIRLKKKWEAVKIIDTARKNKKTGLSDQERRIKESIETLEAKLDDLREARRKAEQRRTGAESRLREADSRISEQEDRLRYLETNFRETREHVNDLRRSQLESRKEISLTKVKLQVTNRQSQTLKDLSNQVDERENSISSDLKSLTERLRDHEKTIEQIRGKRKKTRSELSNHQARLEELTQTIEDDLDVVPARDILKVDLDDNETDDRKRLSEQIRRLKSDIRDLQPVNMLAQEQADELKETVTEVEDQYNDLLDSCEKLESLIDQLNTKARKQFLEAFSDIQDSFEEFVSDLFQGGHGTLELTDDPILEAGVTIEIEPSGEQLRTMSALSGGEKTLGALAFLFALFERKSAPFCFLDEVDHTLDDENVKQFIRLLSRYRDRTQFIVITHNKLTMQAADKLFGVTMEESGVTSIVPMELEHAESLREPGKNG